MQSRIASLASLRAFSGTRFSGTQLSGVRLGLWDRANRLAKEIEHFEQDQGLPAVKQELKTLREEVNKIGEDLRKFNTKNMPPVCLFRPVITEKGAAEFLDQYENKFRESMKKYSASVADTPRLTHPHD